MKTKSGLRPVLRVFYAFALAIAATSPTASVFLTYGSAYSSAGTGLVLGFIIGALLVAGVALSYAETGSVYPKAGGDYSIVSGALGPRFGSIYTIFFAFKGIVIPSVLCIATAAYVHVLIPALPVNWTAFVIMLIILIFAVEDIKSTSKLATYMMIIEVLVLVAFILIALTHIRQPISIIFNPVMPHGNSFISATSAGILASVLSSVFAYNGWEASLYYSEETSAEPKMIGKIVVFNLLTILGLELLGIILATLALPSLNLPSSEIPLAVIVEDALGKVGGIAMVIGLIIAQFDCALSSTFGYGRIYYAIARDRQWPSILNNLFSRTNSRGAPYGAFIVLGVINLIICIFSSLTNLVTFTGVMLMVLYFGVLIASLASRKKVKNPPFKMPLWPIPPLIGIVGTIFVLTQSSPQAMEIVGVMIVLGILWSFFGGRRKVMKKSSVDREVRID